MLNVPRNTSFGRMMTYAFMLVISFYSGSVYALEVNIATMVNNLSIAIPNLMELVTAIGYVMGMFMIIKGLMSLKEHGEQRMSRSSEHGGLKGGLIMILVGSALIYLPSSVQVGLSTFWNNPTPYAYVQETTDSWSELINSVFMIVQLIGTIAFIRGLIMLSHVGQSQQQGGFGKAMAHMIAGILCINMYQFLQAVFTTLGLGQM